MYLNVWRPWVLDYTQSLIYWKLSHLERLNDNKCHVLIIFYHQESEIALIIILIPSVPFSISVVQIWWWCCITGKYSCYMQCSTFAILWLLKVQLTPQNLLAYIHVNVLVCQSKSANNFLNLIKTSKFYALPKSCFECYVTAFWGVWDKTGYDVYPGTKHDSASFSSLYSHGLREHKSTYVYIYWD